VQMHTMLTASLLFWKIKGLPRKVHRYGILSRDSKGKTGGW